MKKIAFSFLAVLMANLVSAQCDKCSAITAGYDGTTLTLLDGVCATLTYPVTSGDCGVSTNTATDKDSDGDGVIDSKDLCPTKAGLSKYKGCPEPDAATKAALEDAIAGVQFETGSDVITKESYPKLDKVSELMMLNKKFKLYLEGHTDNVGDKAFNITLSQKRAAACKSYLVGKGISVKRISSEGFGEADPIADNSTEEGRAKNRRVDFVIKF